MVYFIQFILCLKEHPYGLRSPKNASRGLQSVLQAYIMKHFLFSVRPREKKSVPIDVFVNIKKLTYILAHKNNPI